MGDLNTHAPALTSTGRAAIVTAPRGSTLIVVRPRGDRYRVTCTTHGTVGTFRSLTTGHRAATSHAEHQHTTPAQEKQ